VYSRGFTLIELLLTLLIVAILVAIAVPSVKEQIVIENIRSVAHNLKQELSFARSEAIKRNSDIFVDMAMSDGGATWCVGISVNDNCDCTITDPTLVNACVLPINGVNVRYGISSDDYGDVMMDMIVDFNFRFNAIRGTASPAGSYVFENGAYNIDVTVSLLGRVRRCDNNNNMAGWTSC